MKFIGFFLALAAALFPGVMTSPTSAESRSGMDPLVSAAATPTPQAEETVPYSSYRGISIKTPAAEVAEKLGQPKEKSKAGDFYVFSPNESAQILYDTDQTVKAISVNFTGDLKAAPTPKTVVGVDVKKDADGSISKMVSYPKNGYWVSYNRTGGKDAMIIITVQKLAPQ